MSRRADADAAVIRRAMVSVLGASIELTIARTEHGAVAVVYRVERGDETFFLRLAEEEEENLEVDALLHERLGQAGVLVPAVVHVEAFNGGLRRSIMVTRHIGGNPVAETADPMLAAAIVKRAGHDLAVINQFAVEGFGWVCRREPKLPFVAELADYPSFVIHDLPDPWPGKFGELFSDSDLAQIEAVIGHERTRPMPQASLAHGDLGLDHIFERDGVYTGIIDFGEIRGTEPEFDLGVFFAQTPRENRALLVEAIMTGYNTVSVLPADAKARMRTAAMLKSLRQLGRWLQPDLGIERDPTQMAALISRRFLPLLRDPQ